MVYHLDMDYQNKGPSEKSTHEISTLTSVAPNLELVSMTTNRVQVFLLMESELIFPIIPAVIVVEQKIVVG